MVSNIIRTYMEDGNLALAAVNSIIFPIVRHVSFDGGVICIWRVCVCVCAGYTALFIRNTRNVQFSDYYFIIFSKRITSVCNGITVLTHDRDLVSIVEDIRVVYNGILIVDYVFVYVDKRGGLNHRLEASNESFTLPQHLIDIHQDDAPYL